ncbi:putative disease resistance protein RGA4 [Dendrobium catenatum]|uniref:putative disease resistance protein RGA4 n=1 Tax=Dendrobium catenatum TaxID=906689 RepID=UPI0010A03E59|nr:putative disease resistance protein RGA4 [Dendrobium catenatum]
MHPNLKRLKEVVQKLDKVSAEVSIFLHLLESTKQEQQRELYISRETGSLPRNDLIGRGKEKEFVMQWLRKPSNGHPGTDLYRNISLLSIVWHGGMGKTTLLQHVYEDEMTEEFDLKMWVCVSNNFDVEKVIADMLESLKKEKPNLDSLDALQGKLKEEVMSKRFLLVLDDIWGDEERDKSKWKNVLAPLSWGSLGSKILMTTRMDSAALIIAKVIRKKKETLTLQGLDEDECLQLLNNHAFADVENLDDHKKLRFITGQIAKKLSGSPLAAKVMGGILNDNLDEMHWRKVLDCDIGIIKNDMMSVLRLSYIYLPQPLQSCFTFCCIFPQDHEFDKDDLIRTWIALDFIQLSYNQGETMEDTGGRYFDTLVKKSFFDKYDNYYKMHDLLHKLAQSVSTQECFRIEGEFELSYRIPETIRHLAVNTNNLEVVRKIEKFKNLHSLHLTYSKDDQDFVDVLTKIFETLRSICLLCINNQQLTMIPEAIGCLRHLRYLKMARTSVAQLPRSLSNLYHLMFIIYDKGGLRIHNDFLPKDLNNLFNLRYLKFPWDVIDGMHGIGKLKYLQGLDGFYVKNEIGYKIGELEHMNDLRQLRIKLLKNVKDVEEACSAKINQKRNLIDLSLEWNHLYNNDWRDSLATDHCKSIPETSRSIFYPSLDEKVLDNLQPHNNLKQLRIYSFMGARSAIWMNNINLISNLEYIRLEECLEWQTLPPFGQLPSLKYLLLRNMPKARLPDSKFHGNGNGCLFPSLKVLEIEHLKVLEDWFDARAVAKGDKLFPSLTELYLRDCQHLQELPFLPPKLKKLKIDNIGWKAFNWLQCSSNCCIQELTITKNDELVSFPNEAEQWFPQVSSSLHKLYFMELKSLQSLPSSLASLSSLKILHVKNAPQLQMLPNIPASLEKLVLDNLKSLQCMPSSLSISSLAVLELNNIPLLKSLPELPFSLRLMNIYCVNLYCLPSCLPRLSYLQKISIGDAPLLKELPELPSSLRELSFKNIKSLQTLPSSLTSLSSLEILSIINATQLRLLPNFPTSLEQLSLTDLKSLQCLPSSLSSISSLKYLHLENIPLLKSLPGFHSFLCLLSLYNLENLDSLPSCLSSLSSLQTLNIHNVHLLQELPDLPSSLRVLVFTGLKSLQLLPNISASLEELHLSNLKALQCLPYSLSISSLKNLCLMAIPLLKSLPKLPLGLKYLLVNNVPQLELFPNIPASLEKLNLEDLEALQCLPSSLSISSLKTLDLKRIPLLKALPEFPPGLKCLCVKNVSQLQLLPNIPVSLEELYLTDLEALQCLPYSLSISSLKTLYLTRILLLKSLSDLPPNLESLVVDNVPELQLLPNIPTSLEHLNLSNLKALQCLPSSLSFSSLIRLRLVRIPLLKSLLVLPLGLKYMFVENVPQLQLLPNIPTSLERLDLSDLEALQCLPSSLSISTLKRLYLIRIPLLKSLSDLPPDLKYLSVKNVPQLQPLPNIPASLEELYLSDLEALQCLPSSLSISSLKKLQLRRIPLLKSLPNLPPDLKSLLVYCCHPELMEQYQSFGNFFLLVEDC